MRTRLAFFALFVGILLLLAIIVSLSPGSPVHAHRPASGPSDPAPSSVLTWTPSFTDVAPGMNAEAPGYATAVAWGDYDGDGDLDLYVVNLGLNGIGEANVLLRNDGETFTDTTAEAGVGDAGPGVAAAWADLDNDGDLDLFVSNRPGSNALYINDGSGHFQNEGGAAGVSDPSGYGEGAAWADDDRDGLVDLYVANYSGANGQPNRLFQNLDGSSFQDVAPQREVDHMGNGEGIAWADFDNDGDQDLYIANAGGTNVLFQRQEDGTFEDVTVQMHVPGSGNSFGVAWADYDNDGWLDLYVAQQGTNKLYRNLNGVDFEDVTSQAGVGGGSNRWSLGCAWADFDNDGDLDLHVANADISGYDPADLLFRNDGGDPVTFSDVTAEAGVTNTLDARGSGWADFDGDGDLDLYVVNQGAGQANRLFQNGGGPNHWLVVRLIGCISNRSAIGARVTISGPGDQIREVSGGSGFASQDSLPVEFGLGDWSGSVDVTVDWPSGIRTRLTGVAPDQAITVTEPCSAPDLSDAAKSVTPSIALPGEPLTYTLTIPNTGDEPAVAQVTDTLPLSLTWADHLTATSGAPAWDPVGRNVLWSGGISAGMGVTITYRVTVDQGLVAGGIITNLATVEDDYHPPFDTPPVTVTVLPACQEPGDLLLEYAPPSPIAGEVVTFTGSATGSLPITFSWNFGDGGTGVGISVTHTYTPEGEYVVVLSAANDCGAAVVSETVTVSPPPCDPLQSVDWSWTPLTPTVGEVVTFAGVATGSRPITFHWSFGEGEGGTGATALYTYPVAGEYTVTMTATNPCSQEAVSYVVAIAPALRRVYLPLVMRPPDN